MSRVSESLGLAVHCAYCGAKLDYVAGEADQEGSPLVRHHYLCPHCGQIWIMSSRSSIEARSAQESQPVIPRRDDAS